MSLLCAPVARANEPPALEASTATDGIGSRAQSNQSSAGIRVAGRGSTTEQRPMPTTVKISIEVSFASSPDDPDKREAELVSLGKEIANLHGVVRAAAKDRF